MDKQLDFEYMVKKNALEEVQNFEIGQLKAAIGEFKETGAVVIRSLDNEEVDPILRKILSEVDKNSNGVIPRSVVRISGDADGNGRRPVHRNLKDSGHEIQWLVHFDGIMAVAGPVMFF